MAHDLARIEQSGRIELLLYLGERLGNPWAKLPQDPLAAADAITMLAAEGSLVFAYQLARFLGDGAHLRCAALWPTAAHIQNGSHVQRANRSVGVPGSPCAVTCEHIGEG